MNTQAMHQITATQAAIGLRSGMPKPCVLSAHSPVYVQHEPPSP